MTDAETAELAAELLEVIPEQIAREIVRAHRERWSGVQELYWQTGHMRRCSRVRREEATRVPKNAKRLRGRKRESAGID